jgi:hypothetical protein
MVYVVFLALVLLGGACDTTESNLHRSNNIGAMAADPSGQGVKIGHIWEQPGPYEGREVLLRGSYLGWRGRVEHPRITRSDWALQDDTGAIYITGMPAKGLDPTRDIGRILEVHGTVRLNTKSIPYIQADQVIVMNAEKDHKDEAQATEEAAK